MTIRKFTLKKNSIDHLGIATRSFFIRPLMELQLLLCCSILWRVCSMRSAKQTRGYRKAESDAQKEERPAEIALARTPVELRPPLLSVPLLSKVHSSKLVHIAHPLNLRDWFTLCSH